MNVIPIVAPVTFAYDKIDVSGELFSPSIRACSNVLLFGSTSTSRNVISLIRVLGFESMPNPAACWSVLEVVWGKKAFTPLPKPTACSSNVEDARGLVTG